MTLANEEGKGEADATPKRVYVLSRRPPLVPEMPQPDLEWIIGDWQFEEWALIRTRQLAESTDIVHRTAAVGLLARLGMLTADEARQVPSFIDGAMYKSGPSTRAEMWFNQRINKAMRLRIQTQALLDVFMLRHGFEALRLLVEQIAARSQESELLPIEISVVALRLILQRDDMESVDSILSTLQLEEHDMIPEDYRQQGRTELTEALRQLDDIVGCFDLWHKVRIPDDSQLFALRERQEPHWWLWPPNAD